MARIQNQLAVALSHLGEIAGGRYSLAEQTNPGIPHVAWRYKTSSPELEARIAQTVQAFRGRVSWVFRRGAKNMVIEPLNAPTEPPMGSPAWDAFHAFVREANKDLEALATQVEALARR